MLGAARTSLLSSFTPADYGVSISPTSIAVESSNGSNTTPAALAIVTSGTGPFTYLWTIDNPQVTISDDTEASTTFRSNGYNEAVRAIATITVTDTGNGNLETESTINIIFAFGI